MSTTRNSRIGTLAATLIVMVAALTLMSVTATADQGDTTLISVSTGEVPGDQRSSSPSVSADGRYVAFPSSATNLVED
ncbi:MAG: hypothetical protein GEU79_17600, partial [Acidimicrobiia bacterium]|nr:hypothetical protein [Acidimicrobiia bacterium]